MKFLLFVLCGLWAGMLRSASPAALQVPMTPNEPPPVELKISGPGVIHVGQEVFFKVVVINRSPGSIIVADRGSGKMWSSFWWNVVNAKGEEVPTAPLNPRELLIDDIGGPLNDNEVYVLEPGKKLDYELVSDPTLAACFPSADNKMKCMQRRLFPGKGTYRVRLHYLFVPAGEADYNDSFIRTRTLSPRNIEVLKKTTPVDIISNEWIVQLE